MTQTTDIDTSGFPAGYFVIRSVGTNRLLDVTLDDIEDGTEIALWAEKEKSLVESFRDPKTNNQVFFIDSSGALCSRSAGHAIDVEDATRLVLRHRRPVSLPFPNAYAHPLPKFSYNPHTKEISVIFTCDPTYPPLPAPGGTASSAWQNKTYLLASIPLRKPRTIIENASEFIATSIFTPIAYFTGGPPPTPARPDEVFNADIDLNEDELVEEERGEEAEVDDHPEPARKVQIVSVPTAEKNMMDLLLSEKTRNRRRWIVTPLRTTNARRND